MDEENKPHPMDDYLNQEPEIVYSNFFKKVWYSITKFEKYPEMASEGVGRAFLYLILLMLIFSIIMAGIMTYKFNDILKIVGQYIDENIETIEYENQTLNIETVDEQNRIITDMGTLIIDTDDINNETLEQYRKDIETNNIGIIWLKDRVIVKISDLGGEYYYSNILDVQGITNFDKTNLLDAITQMQTARSQVIYFISAMIVELIIQLIAIIINVLILSLFGVITGWIAGLRVRYRAIFNMSIYAITLPTILQLIYTAINYFIDFNIEYFDFMYTAISYIYLAAAIFMVKSDVIRQQLELLKIANEEKEMMRKRKEKEEQEKREEERRKKEKEEQKDEKKEEEKGDKKEKKDKLDEQAEGQGSNA